MFLFAPGNQHFEVRQNGRRMTAARRGHVACGDELAGR
jgi:hypothetical protein